MKQQCRARVGGCWLLEFFLMRKGKKKRGEHIHVTMPREVRWGSSSTSSSSKESQQRGLSEKNVSKPQQQQCTLNDGTHRCCWKIGRGGTSASGGRQCKSKNALFGLQMAIYSQEPFGYAKAQIAKYKNHLPPSCRSGSHILSTKENQRGLSL